LFLLYQYVKDLFNPKYHS